MMHSDVKISGTNSGIYNILIAVSVFFSLSLCPIGSNRNRWESC